MVLGKRCAVFFQIVRQLLKRLQRKRDHVANFGVEVMQRCGAGIGQQRVHW